MHSVCFLLMEVIPFPIRCLDTCGVTVEKFGLKDRANYFVFLLSAIVTTESRVHLHYSYIWGKHDRKLD